MCHTAEVQENPTITAAEIARLAGVGRAAVSNWRKRHPDFPAPIGGTPASPEFDLIHVEQWLREQGKLPELSTVDRLWRRLTGTADTPAAALVAVGALLLARHRGEPPTTHQPDGRGGERPADHQLDRHLADLLPEIDALADELGSQAAFDELWRRFSTPGPGRPWATSDDLADLMVGLAAVGGGSVLDPACGSGATLRAAVRAGCTSAYGQELDVPLARLAGLWLALRDVPGEVSPGDSIRADAFPHRAVDAVVCHPPFGATNWGQEELDGNDPRWEYGLPPRTEPELAWVQHTLGHLRPGGYAVLLLPPAVASRRAGRRIRAALLRRGALRAVVALPPGATAPHGVPLHLWVLTRPAADAAAPTRALLVDAADGDPAGSYRRVLAVCRAFADAPDVDIVADGFARTVPVIELLDEEVDLTPSRRQPAARPDTGAHLVRTRDRLVTIAGELPGLLPHLVSDRETGTPHSQSVAELIRAGALQLFGPVRPAAAGKPGPEIRVVAGDVVVPMIAPRLTARVVETGGAPLGRNLYLLRPDPATLDPWFLAGQLRTTANERQASSLSGTLRFDIRRAQVRRMPLDEQRANGAVVRRLDAFESAIRQLATLGEELVQLTADGLASGALRPQEQRR
nr:N-6 DNA methylase [Micromonospora sp. DSM 115978]